MNSEMLVHVYSAESRLCTIHCILVEGYEYALQTIMIQLSGLEMVKDAEMQQEQPTWVPTNARNLWTKKAKYETHNL